MLIGSGYKYRSPKNITKLNSITLILQNWINTANFAVHWNERFLQIRMASVV